MSKSASSNLSKHLQVFGSVFILETSLEVPDVLVSFIRLVNLTSMEWDDGSRRKKLLKPKMDENMSRRIQEILLRRLNLYSTTLEVGSQYCQRFQDHWHKHRMMSSCWKHSVSNHPELLSLVKTDKPAPCMCELGRKGFFRSWRRCCPTITSRTATSKRENLTAPTLPILWKSINVDSFFMFAKCRHWF